MNKGTIVLGIDPGTGRTGWGVVSYVNGSESLALEYIAHGCIVTEQTNTMPERLLILHNMLNSLIKQHSPECLIIENIFFGRNVKTAISVSQARGVIMMSAAMFNLPIFEYTPSTVKLGLTGSGKTEKKEIQKIVRRLLNTNSRKLAFNGKKDKDFDDSADALAIALHHGFRSNGKVPDTFVLPVKVPKVKASKKKSK